MGTDNENQPRLSESTSPDTTLCQNCDQEFDWQQTECPHCGWKKNEWVEKGRYGLER